MKPCDEINSSSFLINIRIYVLFDIIDIREAITYQLCSFFEPVFMHFLLTSGHHHHQMDVVMTMISDNHYHHQHKLAIVNHHHCHRSKASCEDRLANLCSSFPVICKITNFHQHGICSKICNIRYYF